MNGWLAKAGGFREPDIAGHDDAVHTLAVALRAADRQGPLTGDSIRQALAQVSFEGITGPNVFDEHGDLKEARFDRFTDKNKQRVKVQ